MERENLEARCPYRVERNGLDSDQPIGYARTIERLGKIPSATSQKIDSSDEMRILEALSMIDDAVYLCKEKSVDTPEVNEA